MATHGDEGGDDNEHAPLMNESINLSTWTGFQSESTCCGKSQLWKGFKFGVAGLHRSILTCSDLDLEKLESNHAWPSAKAPRYKVRNERGEVQCRHISSCTKWVRHRT